ncbi:MAG: hypothetical protein U0989_03250 [Azonexus sp.]|nr:hypothetical protein [Azonexus sp.]MDP3639312.1 hypothetical protein [Azonexus sp.]MDZ4313779.1 hypothetical protein [Azonexus sp.]
MNRSLGIHTPHGTLHGKLDLPENPRSLVLLARSHHTAVDAVIAANFVTRDYAVLTMELLTTQEARFVDATQNVPRLTQRLLDLLDLIRLDGDMQDLPLAIFASGDCSPAAIRVAAQRDTQVQAVTCHGGLLDRAGLQALKLLIAPLLTIFDGDDDTGRTAYLRAASHLTCIHETHRLEIGEDPVISAATWFSQHLRR